MYLYRHIGVAAAFSPRLPALLAEAARHLGQLAPRVSLIHAGKYTADMEARLRHVAEEAGLPEDTTIYWREGVPDDAILRVVEQNDIDLLVAGALEREHPLRYYLGSVARNLVREAPCSLLLFTEPRLNPVPFRRLVFVTDFSETSQIALARAVRLAELESAEIIYVLRVLPEYGAAAAVDRAGNFPDKGMTATTMAEETALLRDFVDAAGKTRVQIRAECIQGHAGVVASQFVQSVDADLLVMPSVSQHSHIFTRIFPTDMEWVLREIPCNLWVARERPPLD